MKTAATIILLCCLVSCSDENQDCIDILEGTYSGICSDASGIMQGNFTINRRIHGNYAGFNTIDIQDDVSYNGDYGAQVSSDCKSININYHSAGSAPDSLSITGVLFIMGQSLTGDIHFYRSGIVKDCTYTLIKL